MNNFFELFGLPVAFEIDEKSLKEQFLQLQKQHHPDHADDQSKAEQNTALINHAFDVLSHHDSRAVYLLELANIDFNSDQSISDESFLMQMMTHRMDLEDATFEENTAQIKTIGDQVSELLARTADEFNALYQQQAWDIAKTHAQKLKFLNNLHKDCVQALSRAIPSNNDDDELYVWQHPIPNWQISLFYLKFI